MTSRTANPWVGLSVLAFAVLGAITTEVVPIGLLPEVQRAFDVDEAGAGVLISLYAITVAITAVPLTRFTRRLARKPILVTTLALFAASNLLSAVAPTFAVLVTARGLAGIAHYLRLRVAAVVLFLVSSVTREAGGNSFCRPLLVPFNATSRDPVVRSAG